MRVLSVEEQKKLVAFLMQDLDIYKLGILVALYTGMRIGELCALRWADVDECCITVRRTMQRLKRKDGSGTELFVGSPKTKTSMRTIPIPGFLKEIIEPFRKPDLADAYFLAMEPNEVIEPRIMQYRFGRHLKETGIKKVNFHALRHTFAFITSPHLCTLQKRGSAPSKTLEIIRSRITAKGVSPFTATPRHSIAKVYPLCESGCILYSLLTT